MAIARRVFSGRLAKFPPSTDQATWLGFRTQPRSVNPPSPFNLNHEVLYR